MRFGPAPKWLDIGQAISRLKEKLETLPVSTHGVSITVAGWQWIRRRNFRPIVVQVERKPLDKPVRVTRSERWWPNTLNLRLYENGGYLRQIDSKWIMPKLKAASSTQSAVDDVEAVLAEVIRKVSATNPAVGPNLMSIVLLNPRRPLAHVGFLPHSEHQIVTPRPGSSEILSVHFSPWIVGPDHLLPPRAEIGTSSLNLRGVFVEVAGAPPPTSGILALSVPQPRPREPL